MAHYPMLRKRMKLCGIVFVHNESSNRNCWQMQQLSPTVLYNTIYQKNLNITDVVESATKWSQVSSPLFQTRSVAITFNRLASFISNNICNWTNNNKLQCNQNNILSLMSQLAMNCSVSSEWEWHFSFYILDNHSHSVNLLLIKI